MNSSGGKTPPGHIALSQFSAKIESFVTAFIVTIRVLLCQEDKSCGDRLILQQISYSTRRDERLLTIIVHNYLDRVSSRGQNVTGYKSSSRSI
jgi:hypothetical protein